MQWRDPDEEECPRLIQSDGLACWLFPDGSHRAITQNDVDQINHLLEYARRLRMGVKIEGA